MKRRSFEPSICFVLVLFALAATWQGLFVSICQGQSALSRLVKRSARMVDDVAIRNLDEIQRFARQSPEAVESVLKRELDDSFQQLGKTRALRKALGQMADIASDRSTARLIEQLDDQTLEAAVLICSGSKRLADDIGDLTLRSRMIRDGGAETLAAIGRHADLGDAYRRFYVAVDAGKIRSPKGLARLTPQTFGEFFTKRGEQAKHFWDTYVSPNWKLWATGTALAAVMLSPDEYLDAVGNITESGLKKIGRLGGSVLEGALRGGIEAVGETVKGAVDGVAQGTANAFFSSPTGWAALFLIGAVACLLFPPSRALLYVWIANRFRSGSKKK